MGFNLINAYKNESQVLRHQIDEILNALLFQAEEVMTDVHPGLTEDYRNLKNAIKEQKDENETLYQELL